MQSNDFDEWDVLMASAEQVLRGAEVTGPFAAMADTPWRRRLASELMLDCGPVDEGWRHAFLAHVDRHDCSLPVAREPAGYEPFGRAPGNDLRDLNAPRAWSRFVEGSFGTAKHRNRQQAARAFPWLVALAVAVAHAVDRWPRVHAAWKVLDAIDHARPLVPALRAFLQVGKGAIRAARSLCAKPWEGASPASWSAARRILSAVAALPVELRPHTSGEWRKATRYWPWLIVLARRRGRLLSQTLPLETALMADLQRLSTLPKKALRQALRVHARALAGASTWEWRCLRVGLHRPAPNAWACRQGAPLMLPSHAGWTACPLYTLREWIAEAVQMEHCGVTMYHEELRSDQARFFSLRSPDSTERASLMMTLNADGSLDIQIAGPGNRPCSVDAQYLALDIAAALCPGSWVNCMRNG